MSFPYYWDASHKVRWAWWQCVFPAIAVIVVPGILSLAVGIVLGPIGASVLMFVLIPLAMRWLVRSSIIDRKIDRIHDDADGDMQK